MVLFHKALKQQLLNNKKAANYTIRLYCIKPYCIIIHFLVCVCVALKSDGYRDGRKNLKIKLQ